MTHVALTIPLAKTDHQPRYSCSMGIQNKQRAQGIESYQKLTWYFRPFMVLTWYTNKYYLSGLQSSVDLRTDTKKTLV
jgi:hypothetical protein